MDTFESLVRDAAWRLARGGVADPERDAEVLLAHVLGADRGILHSHPERPVAAADVARYRGFIDRRARREPLQYLTGEQEFWSLPFRVTPAVLIPRPETEHLLEALLDLTLPRAPLVLDLGTGSGCLAIAAARELPGARLHASDADGAALAVARGNAARHSVLGRVTFLHGDLFVPLEGRGLERGFDAIVSNPPYIPEADLAGLEPEVRDYEPRGALSPGPDGMAAHRRIAREAARWLRPGGHLLVEIGFGQEAEARALYAPGADLVLVGLRPDLAGVPRVVVARAR
jgi:release factor glutamine methyltransferase